MKVKHTNPPGRSPDSWLKEGEIYTVLEIYSGKGGITYRLLTTEESTTPALHDAEVFTIEDPRIPLSWIVSVIIDRDGKPFMHIGPEPWIQADFWDKFFDWNEEARRCFDEELRKL